AANFGFLTLNKNGTIHYQDTSTAKIDSISQIIADSAMFSVIDLAQNRIGNAKANLEYSLTTYKERSKDIRKFDIEWQRKLALSFACFVLFLIGAPLGSIIRKGGLGAPLVFGIIFFVVFHLLNTMGEKLAKEGVITPFGGMWMATMVLLPVGAFLTYKAMHDSELMNKEFYYRVFSKIKAWYGQYRLGRKKASPLPLS
ncbi:MAG TPA: LptF/LptG family permease, partial [Phnomibacter sp.]|nr:LptF/LptG family permease [Phnomibacter sp.]